MDYRQMHHAMMDDLARNWSPEKWQELLEASSSCLAMTAALASSQDGVAQLLEHLFYKVTRQALKTHDAVSDAEQQFTKFDAFLSKVIGNA